MRAGDRVGDFEVVRKAAAGGCGVVYEGRDGDGRRVAIKILVGDSERAVRRFEREAELLASLEHPNIAAYISHGVTPAGDHYLIEEWIGGEVLAETLTDPGLTMVEAVEMVRDVASALAVAHRAGIVHRDIKPGNIVRNEAKTAWSVLDFGIARVLADEQRLTRTGALVGTVGYMAPEQARGDRDVEAPADVFALGCVLYEALTGQAAFAGLNRLSIRAKILLSDPPPIRGYQPETPPDLAELTHAMLDKEASGRPADGYAILACLDALGPMPETRPRPLEILEQPTVEMPIKLEPRSELTSLVLTSALAHLAGDDLDSWRRRLRAAVDRFPGRPWILEDGALVFASAPTDSGPEVAARAALAARHEFPDLAITVVSTERRAAVGDTIERAATALERETVHNIFADFTPEKTEEIEGGIAIDEATASRLPAHFAVVRAGDKLILEGVSDATASKDQNGD